LPFELNRTLATLPVYLPGKPIEEVARELGIPAEGIVKMASNENPLGPSPKALAAIQKAAGQIHYYPDGNAFYLKQKLAQKYAVQSANLALGNGSNELLELIGHVLLGPGDEVVAAHHCFAVYPIVTSLFGAKLVSVPAKNYGHDLTAMAKAVTAKTRAVFVANPNNPTGTHATQAELLKFIEAIPARVLIVLDEAYLEFMDTPLDLVSLVRQGRHPNVILLRTFSKIYGLAGLRVGYGLGHPDFIAALEKARQPFNVNLLAQAGALAALDDTAHLEKARSINREGLDFLNQACQRLGLEYVPSQTNFILVKVGDGVKVFQAMQQSGVIVRPVANYQLPEWIRITVGLPDENRRCLDALKKALGR